MYPHEFSLGRLITRDTDMKFHNSLKRVPRLKWNSTIPQYNHAMQCTSTDSTQLYCIKILSSVLVPQYDHAMKAHKLVRSSCTALKFYLRQLLVTLTKMITISIVAGIPVRTVTNSHYVPHSRHRHARPQFPII